MTPTKTDDHGGEKNNLEEPAYLYKDSGIREREGKVPFWLWMVAIGLLAWGSYYLVRYWNPPP